MCHVGREKIALETDSGLRSSHGLEQDINFCEHEVSYLYNEGSYSKQGAQEVFSPFLAHNSRRKCVMGTLYKNQWVIDETVPSG